MTYRICYRDPVMFDIEYNMTQNECNKEEWYSEVHCLPIIEGLSRFLKDNLNKDGFKFEEFVRDATDIEEVRGLLYEVYDNYPRELEEAREFHYKVFRPILDSMLMGFCDKYGLELEVD